MLKKLEELLQGKSTHSPQNPKFWHSHAHNFLSRQLSLSGGQVDVQQRQPINILSTGTAAALPSCKIRNKSEDADVLHGQFTLLS